MLTGLKCGFAIFLSKKALCLQAIETLFGHLYWVLYVKGTLLSIKEYNYHQFPHKIHILRPSNSESDDLNIFNSS